MLPSLALFVWPVLVSIRHALKQPSSSVVANERWPGGDVWPGFVSRWLVSGHPAVDSDVLIARELYE